MQNADPTQTPSPLVTGYLTADLPGTGGVCRATPEDFYVEELPAYGPTGSGQHTLFAIEKRGIGTPSAIGELARALGVPPDRIGCAGLKDAQAVARQQLSVEGAPPERVRAVRLPNVTVLWAEPHKNRLKIGHLRGNRFVIRVRGVPEGSLPLAEEVLGVLGRRGVPNAFGYQRFGIHGSTHLLGRALVRGDADTFFRLYLASSGDLGEGPSDARERAATGDWAGALDAWPVQSGHNHRALQLLVGRSDTETALRLVPRGRRRLFVAAYQAALFNRLLAQRLDATDRLEAGDLAMKHSNGACFLVEQAEVEQPRADALEISPTAPLYGHKARLAEGAPGQRERAVLAEEGLTLRTLRVRGVPMPGARRALRVPLEEVTVRYDEGLVIAFRLPAGAYATNVLREVTKTS